MPGGDSSPPTASVGPTADTAPQPSNAWLTDAEIARAITFRRTTGLRSDETWVRLVAAAPDARAGIAAYSIPLMPDEIRTIQDRARTADQIMEVVEDYGEARPEDWAGAIADNAHGRVVALFANRLQEHEAELRKLVQPDAPLDVLKAQWSLRDLESLYEAIKDDRAWLREHDIYPLGFGVDKSANKVFLDVSTARRDVETLLIEHFGAAGKLTVTSDGTGVRLLPTGTLRGTVIDTTGEPLDFSVEGYLIELVGDVPGTGGSSGSTAGSGRFIFKDIAAVGYEIQVFREIDMVLLGTERAVVRAGKTTDVTVVVDLE